MNFEITYIECLDKYGWIEESKFKSTLKSENLPLKGDKILTFYNEEKPFYNFSVSIKNSDNETYEFQRVNYETGKIEVLTEKDIEIRTKDLMISWISQLMATNSKNLNYKRYPFEKMIDDILSYGKKAYNIDVKDLNKDELFNEVKYQDLSNEIWSMGLCCGEKMPIKAKIFRYLLAPINTFLAEEKFITHFGKYSKFVCDNNDLDSESSEEIIANNHAILHIAEAMRVFHNGISLMHRIPPYKNIDVDVSDSETHQKTDNKKSKLKL
jgi:hypothetical protein